MLSPLQRLGLVVGIFLIGMAVRVSPGADAKAQAEPPGAPVPPPPPELKVLQRFVGSWDTAGVSQVAEWTPREINTTGRVTMEWALGGRFVQGKGTDTLPSELTMLWGYDADRRAYRTWLFNSLGLAIEWTGDWDDRAQTFVVRNDVGNGLTGTLTTRFVGDDRIEWRSQVKDGDGKLYHSWEGTWTRRK
ncbi:MAG TPA: DUF1579 family protein [Tepidisphaeraceae bacterium]|jgi:hypothetical protein